MTRSNRSSMVFPRLRIALTLAMALALAPRTTTAGGPLVPPSNFLPPTAPGVALLLPANPLPPPPCDSLDPVENYLDGQPAQSFFSHDWTTPQGHFTIYYGLDAQALLWGSETCFPEIWPESVNEQRFVENVGSMLEQVYAFYAGDTVPPTFAGLGFDLPAHIEVRLYNARNSVASTGKIRLKIGHVYVHENGDYRIRPRTFLHEIFHKIQLEAGAPGAGRLVDWYGEGTARYANLYLGSVDDATGEFLQSFDAAQRPTQLWDLSVTQEWGSYHHGSHFWRFLTHNWSVAGISDAQREAATHFIALPWNTGAGDDYRLQPRRGIFLLQDVLSEIAQLDAAGSCPAGDECIRTATTQALAGRSWLRSDGHLFDFRKAYRAFAAENVRLEGPGAGDPVANRFRGKFKATGVANAKPVDRAPVETVAFQTLGEGDHTIIVTGSAASGAQNASGDDDDMRFELDGLRFGKWNSDDAFDGDALEGRTATRFLRTRALLRSGLPGGSHQLVVLADEQPRRKQVRVVRGDVAPLLAEEGLDLSTPLPGTSSTCPGSYTLSEAFEYDSGRLTGGVNLLASARLDPDQVSSTVLAIDGSPQWYVVNDEVPSYKTDAPQVLKSEASAGLPVSVRSELPGKGGTTLLELCTRPKQGVTSHAVDGVYVYPRPEYDVFDQIHGELHEYSVSYEVFVPDPQATTIRIELVGESADRFLTVHGQLPGGARVILSEDAWDPTATPPTVYAIPNPGDYTTIVVGVGAYGFEAFDPALVDLSLRSTLPYTLRIESQYGGGK